MNSITIGRPTDFRRLEFTEKQRRSLIPLQLSPVVLRGERPGDNDSPHRSTSSLNFEDMLDSPRDSYRASRGSPFLRCQQLTSSSPGLTVNPHGQIVGTPTEQKPSHPLLSTRSSSSSMQSLRRPAIETRASAGSISSRNSFERGRVKRKRSGLRGSRDSTDLDLDREILELNTIVEERRAEATQSQSSNNQHVPAVAPRMPVRARSETLSDIGSAFSRPLLSVTTSSLELSDANSQLAAQTMSPATPVKSRLSRPFTSMPDPIVEQSTPRHVRRPSSRITGWLSNLLSSSNTASHHDTTQDEATQRCAVSETSFCTTVSEMDSPTLTSSSPISKTSHSRSLTAESRMTPISPPSTVDEHIEPLYKYRVADRWPAIAQHHPSQVGVAL